MAYKEEKDPLTEKGKRHVSAATSAVLGLTKSVIVGTPTINPNEHNLNAQEIMDVIFYRKSPWAVKTKATATKPAIYVPVYKEITLEAIQKHLDGGHTIAAYQSRPDETCLWATIDFDDFKYEEVAKQIYREQKASGVFQSVLIEPKFEESESRGYHIWFFFKTPQTTEFAYKMLINILATKGLEKGTNNKIDVYPRAEHLTGKKFGAHVRVPKKFIEV